MENLKQLDYLKKVAEKYYDSFYEQGFATAGNNGPHGHLDTPVRNTGHFLIIYSYMYKITKDEKYLKICEKFADYLCDEVQKSKSGAIQCMVTNKFDYLNGLIGQGWTIEALMYFYEISRKEKYLEISKKIFYSQKYDYKLHLWHRIELDGSNIGIDPTYNHNIWFAACASKILDYDNDEELKNIIYDLLTKGAERDFRIYKDGLLKHSVKIASKKALMIRIKRMIKILLYPIRNINLRKLDYKYMEKAYHVFDMYGFCILEERFPELPLFKSLKYKKAKKYALNVEKLNKEYNIYSAIENKTGDFNVFSYSYNSLAFEFPYVSTFIGKEDKETYENLYELQCKLMYDENKDDFSKNNPDVITFDARTYEIIRYCELKWRTGKNEN